MRRAMGLTADSTRKYNTAPNACSRELSSLRIFHARVPSSLLRRCQTTFKRTNGHGPPRASISPPPPSYPPRCAIQGGRPTYHSPSVALAPIHAVHVPRARPYPALRCASLAHPPPPTSRPLPTQLGTRAAEGHRKGGLRHWVLRSRVRCAAAHASPPPTALCTSSPP